MYRIDNWINEGSGWKIDSVNSESVNISKYAPLFGSSFIKLPSQIENPKKGLINIKNKDNKCFLWCHVRHLNPVNNNSTRINKKDKKWLILLTILILIFLFLNKIIVKLK